MKYLLKYHFVFRAGDDVTFSSLHTGEYIERFSDGQEEEEGDGGATFHMSFRTFFNRKGTLQKKYTTHSLEYAYENNRGFLFAIVH